MLARVVRGLRKLVGKEQRLVGSDKHGNQYYQGPHVVDGNAVEKRWVEFKGDYEPSSLPVEWNSWLNGSRQMPPTPEEIMEMELRRRSTLEKAAVLAQEEEKRRFQAASLGLRQRAAEGPMSMAYVMEQLEAGSPEPQRRPLQHASQEQTSRGNTPQSEPRGRGAGFVPGVWQPPGAEQAGKGDDFQPESWQPGSESKQ
eukprot:jgi/Chlat1/4403/Chrsp29S04533